MSQAALATELGWHQSYVAKVEVLERRLDVLEYVLWTRALGLDPSTAIEHLATAATTNLLLEQPSPKKITTGGGRKRKREKTAR